MEKDLKIIAKVALDEFMKAREVAKNALIQIVKEHNNFIPLIPVAGKPEVCVYNDCNDYYPNEIIFGIQYVEGEGLFVCTETCLDNYEYDNDYEFFSYLEPTEEDIKHINTALESLAYYVSFDEDSIVQSTSLISILATIQHYL